MCHKTTVIWPMDLWDATESEIVPLQILPQIMILILWQNHQSKTLQKPLVNLKKCKKTVSLASNSHEIQTTADEDKSTPSFQSKDHFCTNCTNEFQWFEWYGKICNILRSIWKTWCFNYFSLHSKILLTHVVIDTFLKSL